MNRRHYLAIFGAVALTGCSQNSPTSEPTPNKPTGSPTDTPPGTLTPTPPSTATETSTPTETDTPTGTETPTPDPIAEQARQRLDQAREYLNRAVETYISYAEADDPTILDVGPTDDFDTNEVRGWAGNAFDQINSAERIAGDRISDEIEAHWSAFTFVSLGAQLQNRLRLSYELMGSVSTYLHEENFNQAASEVVSMDDHLKTGDDYLLDISTNTDAAGMAHLDAVSEEQREAKIDQWKAELDAFDGIQRGLAELADGIQTMTTAMEEYSDGDNRYTGFAPRIISDGRDALSEAPTPASIEDDLEELRSLARAFAGAASSMDSAAAARENGNSRAAGRQECDARESIVQYSEYRDFTVGRRIFDIADCEG